MHSDFVHKNLFLHIIFLCTKTHTLQKTMHKKHERKNNEQKLPVLRLGSEAARNNIPHVALHSYHDHQWRVYGEQQ